MPAIRAHNLVGSDLVEDELRIFLFIKLFQEIGIVDASGIVSPGRRPLSCARGMSFFVFLAVGRRGNAPLSMEPNHRHVGFGKMKGFIPNFRGSGAETEPPSLALSP